MTKFLVFLVLFTLIACTSTTDSFNGCNSYEECPQIVGSIRPDEESRNSYIQKRWPVLVYATPPIYPKEMLTQKIQGFVIVRFDISTNGLPINIEVIDAFPKDVFDKNAIAAVSHFKYEERTSVLKGHQTKITFTID
ncbi:hypothetical protein MAH1_22810 [Sessilibacter sp. MAH1]